MEKEGECSQHRSNGLEENRGLKELEITVRRNNRVRISKGASITCLLKYFCIFLGE